MSMTLYLLKIKKFVLNKGTEEKNNILNLHTMISAHVIKQFCLKHKN